MKNPGYILAILAMTLLTSCSLFTKKDNEAMERIRKYQEETAKQVDSLKQREYKELMDSVNNENNKMIKELDSLKHKSDSMDIQIQKNMDELNKRRLQPEKKNK